MLTNARKSIAAQKAYSSFTTTSPDRRISSFTSLPPHGFGICILLLTIAHPHPTNTPTIGCTCPIPKSNIPPTTPLSPPSTIPLHTHHAIPDTIPNEVGIGVPSKYLLFPVLSLGREETVTLKRARRVRPQRTKKERRRLSSGVRRPRAKAQEAGATPKDICGKIHYQQHVT